MSIHANKQLDSMTMAKLCAVYSAPPPGVSAVWSAAFTAATRVKSNSRNKELRNVRIYVNNNVKRLINYVCHALSIPGNRRANQVIANFNQKHLF